MKIYFRESSLGWVGRWVTSRYILCKLLSGDEIERSSIYGAERVIRKYGTAALQSDQLCHTYYTAIPMKRCQLEIQVGDAYASNNKKIVLGGYIISRNIF